MHPARHVLLNTPEIEVWPAGLLRARANADARQLATAQQVLRRKRDGRFLASVRDGELRALVPALSREPGIEQARRALSRESRRRPGPGPVAHLPLSRLADRMEGLGLDAGSYAARTGLPLVAEPERLRLAGFDRYRRPLWLHPGAARAWERMRHAAMRDGVVLEAISGYRSHDYQLGIFERKLARGQSVEEILAVNAAPGFSEHHSGRAMDIGAPDEPPAEESFEGTAAFAWLAGNAGDHGFAMSYPRGNPHGIVHEPWHWCWSLP
jgi:zinc D-Ala-D-Ala carboxypeptidase